MKFKARRMAAPSTRMTTLLAVLAAGSIAAAGQTENILYDFQGGADGGQPAAGLIADKAGNLYGTTTTSGAGGFGTVFELSPPVTPGGSWTQTTLYSFQGFLTGADGANPQSALVMDGRGNLYGTTASGGNTCGFSYCGTVFKLTRPHHAGGTWQESVIYSFSGPDGQSPYGALAWGTDGRLYGTTTTGGANGLGTVFVLIPPDDNPAGPWKEEVLYSFASAPDGGVPFNAVVLDRAGNLYGTTNIGGAMDLGSVFKLTRPSLPHGAWTESILYSFTGGSDGASPYSGVVFDARGNLYGAAWGGGDFSGGTIYQLTPPATTRGAWSENTLYQFTGATDGSAPVATPILDRNGNIFGTASQGDGGTFAVCAPYCGSVFELSPPASAANPWVETTLYSFVGVNGLQFDGAFPIGSLLLGKQGVLFGTTMAGGDFVGDGAAFEIVR